jgi:hypothetical protein
MSALALPTRPLWVLLLSLGLLAVTAVDARAGDPLSDTSPSQSLPDSVRQAALRDFHGPDMEGKDGPLAKAGLDLLLLYHQHRTRSGGGRALSAADEPGETARGDLQVQNGRVVVDATAAGDVAALAADLDSLGMTDVATAGGLVSGRFPIEKTPALARLATLRGVQPARARTRSGRSSASTTPIRPSQSAPADRLASSEDSATPSEKPPPDETPPPDDEPASTAPGASADGESTSSATAPPTPSEETASTDALPEDASTAIWSVLALIAIVLFLEER